MSDAPNMIFVLTAYSDIEEKRGRYSICKVAQAQDILTRCCVSTAVIITTDEVARAGIKGLFCTAKAEKDHEVFDNPYAPNHGSLAREAHAIALKNGTCSTPRAEYAQAVFARFYNANFQEVIPAGFPLEASSGKYTKTSFDQAQDVLARS